MSTDTLSIGAPLRQWDLSADLIHWSNSRLIGGALTANTEWLEANPMAASLLANFTMDVLDVSLMNVEMADGADVETLAADWIVTNRDLVDGWLEEAQAAS